MLSALQPTSMMSRFVRQLSLILSSALLFTCGRALPVPFFNADRRMHSAAGNITRMVEYADATWNCNGSFPPCPDCKHRVPRKSGQSPYGCAPYVAHALVAGGFVNDPSLTECGGGGFSSVKFNGRTYDLNVVSHQDPNCGQGGACLMDYLLARGWTTTNSVKAGTVVAVVGSEGPFCHVVLGVGNGIVNAHNDAEYHVAITNYHTNLMLDPPLDAEYL